MRRQIQALQQQLMLATGLMDGRVAQENLHLTLRFLGQVPTAGLEPLHHGLCRVAAQPFELQLDRWGQFTRPGILWIGPSQPPESLLALQAAVAGASHDIRRPPVGAYKPHVTLFRKVNHLPEVTGFAPISWHIEQFVLVESMTRRTGVKYRVLQEYPF